MPTATIIDIPHGLGRAEAKHRMTRGVAKLASHNPGGAASVTHSWASADQMSLTVVAMGMKIPCTVDADDTRRHVTLQLPAMLRLMADPIKIIVHQQGERLLRDQSGDQES